MKNKQTLWMKFSNLEWTATMDRLMPDEEARTSPEWYKYKCQHTLKEKVGLVGKSKTHWATWNICWRISLGLLFKSLFTLTYLCVYVHMHAWYGAHVCGNQRTTHKSQYSPSTISGPGIKLSSPDLLATAFTFWAILLVLKWFKDLYSLLSCHIQGLIE